MPSESPPAIPDSELALRAQQGDEPAFAELLHRHEQRVFNLCFRLCRNHADALDAAQATYLNAWQALSRYESRSGFFTWLYRIAVNVALSQRRARKRRATVSLGRPAEEENVPTRLDPAIDDDPARSMEQAEARARLETALAALDEEFRVAVVLRDIEEFDYATIAELIGVPVGTVKSRIFRGRMILREMLSGPRAESRRQAQDA